MPRNRRASSGTGDDLARSALPVANEPYFRFLRARKDFVAAGASRDSIEAYIVWAVAVAALARIHARRMKRPLRPDRDCFIKGLLELAPGYSLGTISVPLLAHDLRTVRYEGLIKHPVFGSYSNASYYSRVWLARDDLSAAEGSALLKAGKPRHIVKIIDENTYAAILYAEYRCCVVHGVQLGMKTYECPDFYCSPPVYEHYLGSGRRTRIRFPLPYLAEILDTMIAAEENESISAGWRIPPYPTLE